MSEHGGITLAGGLWGIAFATLVLAAFVAKPDAQGVASVAFVGHAFNALAIAIDRPARATPQALLSRRYTIATLAIGLVGEGIGSAIVLGLGEPELALWLLLGLSFAAAGIATTLRRAPGDHVFACQIFFHGTFLFPLIAAFLAYLLASSGVDEGDGRPVGLVAMSLAVFVFRSVWIPLLFVALLSVLAYNLTRSRGHRELCWDVLVANQASFVVIVFRWAANGL